MIKSKFKRVTSLFLATLMCVTTFAGIGSTTAYAASGEKADVYMVDFPRDGDANYDGVWGHSNLTLKNGWHTGRSNFTNLKAIGSYSGNVAYCIEPGISLKVGQTMNKYDENYFNNLAANGVISGDEIRLFVGRILQYGYRGTISTSWRSQNEAAANSIAQAYATQLLIWELPELKLLIDAVESSKFITKKKSETLIEKIHTMTSPGQVAKLKRNNYVVNRIKPDNEQIYYIIDAINDAINAGKQISFQYYDYTGLKKKVLKNKGEIYKLSPYKLLWCGDYYYVLGYSEKQKKVINFRVDRIVLRPDILAKDIIPMPDDFDIENFTKEVFFMFSGEKVLVDLRCDNSLMKTMVDRFGEDVTTLAYDMTSFRVQTEVSASPTFFGWVFGFNGKVQILAPESVKEQYKQMIAQADEGMQEKGNKEQEM